MTSNKITDDQGSHLVDLAMAFHITFPDDENGRAAAGILPDAIARTHDRLCTVSRTVEIGTPVVAGVANETA